MMFNKKSKLLALSALVLIGGLSLPITSSLIEPGVINFGVTTPSCEDYWTNSTYTSLYELTQKTSFSECTTWGTVASCYQNSSSGYCAYIQSRDKNGHVAGALLYSYSTTDELAAGTLVEITGTPAWRYGQLRFTSITPTVKTTSWYEAEASQMTTSDWLTSASNVDTTSPLWTNAIGYGARKTILKNVTIGTAGSAQTTVTFSDGTNKALLYYSDPISATKTAIKTALGNYTTADVTGYMHCYQNGATNIMELQMVSASDITSATTENISVSSVALSDTTLTMSTASPVSLTATISPSNATNQNVSWSSSDTSVATVSSGEITGLKAGTTTITVTTEDGNKTATCEVSVTSGSIAVTGVTLNQSALSMYVDDTANLTASISPSGASNKNVTWSTTNSAVATINNGTVTAVSSGTATITVTTSDGGFTASCDVSVSVSESLSEITLNSSSGFTYGSYDTNFGIDTIASYEYGFYRAGSYSGGLVTLYDDSNYHGYEYNNLQGALYNDTPINGIKKITVTYQSTGGLNVCYGVSKARGYSTTLASASSATTVTVNCSVASCYFSVETNGATAKITSIVIGYNSSLTTNTTTSDTANKRIAPTVYSGTLEDGVSSVTVPNSITITGNTYTVNSTKTYTYYSYDYCASNTGVISSAAMTDPVDISNYYIAFKAIPANFGGSGTSETCATVSNVNSIFGDDARKISEYTRTDGYAVSVPYTSASYYEFDVALLSAYTTSNRGTGRLVMWRTGWSCYSDGAPVATYTDDHYATFAEYLNYGSFGERFDAESSSLGFRTGRTMPTSGSTELTLA